MFGGERKTVTVQGPYFAHTVPVEIPGRPALAATCTTTRGAPGSERCACGMFALQWEPPTGILRSHPA